MGGGKSKKAQRARIAGDYVREKGQKEVTPPRNLFDRATRDNIIVRKKPKEGDVASASENIEPIKELTEKERRREENKVVKGLREIWTPSRK